MSAKPWLRSVEAGHQFAVDPTGGSRREVAARVVELRSSQTDASRLEPCFAVTAHCEDHRVDARLLLTLMALVGGALTAARLVGARRHRRLIADLKLLLVAAVLVLSPSTVQAAATIEANAATERLQAEAERFGEWFERWYLQNWHPTTTTTTVPGR